MQFDSERRGPSLIMSMWLFVLLEPRISLHKAIVLGLAFVLVMLMFFLFSLFWVWLQKKGEEERAEASAHAARTNDA